MTSGSRHAPALRAAEITFWAGVAGSLRAQYKSLGLWNGKWDYPCQHQGDMTHVPMPALSGEKCKALSLCVHRAKTAIALE